MGKEYEFQILDINVNTMKKKLKELKGKQIHKEIKMRRALFRPCDSDYQITFARVRDEGKDTTLTVKKKNKTLYPDEYEVTIKEDFNKALEFMKALNLENKSYQENYREKWTLPIKGVHEITFDTWPGAPTYMEVDCETEESMNKVRKLLGVKNDQIMYGNITKIWGKYYDVTNEYVAENLKSIKFEDFDKNHHQKM